MYYSYNGQLFGPYKKCSEKLLNGRILFHDTCPINTDGISEKKFLCEQQRKTDGGRYGKGLYFTSSPKYAIFYCKSYGKRIIYLLGSLVALEKMLHIQDGGYFEKDLHADYNSHYVRVDKTSNNPITNDNEDYYEEYIVKNNEQTLPPYVISLCHT
ncbi:unnamed protein product, partial [Didymodactylos carnosus]